MNGQALYQRYTELNLEIANCGVDAWHTLPEDDQQIWNRLSGNATPANTDRWHTRPDEKRRPFCVYDENGLKVAFFTSSDDAALAARAPGLFAFAQTIAGMETEDEINERTDDDGMCGDDAVETVSRLIKEARKLIG